MCISPMEGIVPTKKKKKRCLQGAEKPDKRKKGVIGFPASPQAQRPQVQNVAKINSQA